MSIIRGIICIIIAGGIVTAIGAVLAMLNRGENGVFDLDSYRRGQRP